MTSVSSHMTGYLVFDNVHGHYKIFPDLSLLYLSSTWGVWRHSGVIHRAMTIVRDIGVLLVEATVALGVTPAVEAGTTRVVGTSIRNIGSS